MDAKTLDDLFSQLQQPPLQAKASASVTPEMLMSKVMEIRKRGYYVSRDALPAIEAYLNGYGLAIGGDSGVGKTSLFSVIADKPITVVSLLAYYPLKLDDIYERITSLKDEEILVDDIGREAEYNNYGCRLDLLPWVIEVREWLRVRTHFTTNKSSSDLERRYGMPVMDRLRGMCKFYKFQGKSFRTPRAFATETKRYDWSLCRERCGSFDGSKCSAGQRFPCGCTDWPIPPEECKGYKPRSQSQS